MKKFGKLTALVLSAAMLLSITACGTNEVESKPPEKSNTEQTDPLAYREIPNTYLSIATGSSGGGWYIMGALFNDAFETNIPGLKMTLLPGGGASNPTAVDAGADTQVGFTYITYAKAAVEGTGDYAESKCENLYALANISVKQYLYLLIVAGSPYSDFESIVAEQAPLKFAVGPRAGGNEVAFNRILKAYGASFDDIESWGGSIQYISAQEGCDAVKDGQIDGNVNLSAVPQSNLLELMTSREMKWLEVNEAVGKELADTYGYTYEQLPANTYAGQTEPIDTIVDTVLLVVNGDVPEDVVFNLTKCLCENEQLWADGYEALSAFDPANAANTGIALHPGAEAYYKAAGFLN